MHAIVRDTITNTDDWNREKWGLPINQMGMVGTIFFFSGQMISGLRMLGIWLSKKEREAVIHQWRYIGLLMGVDQNILPKNESESWRLAYLLIQVVDIENENHINGPGLARALANVPLTKANQNSVISKWLRKMERGYRVGISRIGLMGRADILELDNTFWKYLMLLSIPVVFTLDSIRKIMPGGTLLANKVGDYIHGITYLKNIKKLKEVTFIPTENVGSD